MTLYDQVMEAAAAVQSRSDLKPAVALILGSGLGDLAVEIRDATAMRFADVRHGDLYPPALRCFRREHRCLNATNALHASECHKAGAGDFEIVG